jgi:CPA2 family monovalent cation:H+ antiporter-2
MLLGGIGAIGSRAEIEAIAELGVALLLFSLGLEFSLERLKKLGPQPLIAGILQVVITLLMASLAAYLLGFEIKESIGFGAMISLSSTAVVLRILMERSEIDVPHGRNSLAVLLVQDISVVPLAILMTLLGGDGTALEVVYDVGKLVFLSAGLVAGLYFVNRIAVIALGTLTFHRNRELTILLAVVTGLGATWLAHTIGISPALGAFVAGMLLGSSAFATQIRADISSLRVLLLTLFFGAAGMVVEPLWMIENALLLISFVAALTIGKGLIIWGIFQSLGQSIRVSAATGLCLAQVGEFAFVLGSLGRGSGVISSELYSLVVSATIISFFLSAFLVPRSSSFGHYVAALFRRDYDAGEKEESSDKAPDIVIIGFGPAGEISALPFVDCHRDVLVIDLNHKGVRRARELGFRAQVGDATQSDVLEHADLSRCKVIAITIPDQQSARLILEQVRTHAPHVHTVVRSRYQIHGADFDSAGAHVVIGDEEEVGSSLARAIQDWITEKTEEKSEQGAWSQTGLEF